MVNLLRTQDASQAATQVTRIHLDICNEDTVAREQFNTAN